MPADNYLCTTCGVQFAASAAPPARCPICEDERQYVNWQGQAWTTLAQLQATHQNLFREEEPGMIGIGTTPAFAIGQRALLLQTSQGNILWDCISLIDEATIDRINACGGLAAIAISHPHYYGAMAAWSQAFGHAPIYLHAADREWVLRPDPAIVFWQGATHPLGAGVTLIHCGGHFPGAAVLHWAAGAAGRGVLCVGDTLQVASDRRCVSFMYSYPNYIPLSAAAVRRIVTAVQPFQYDRIYGAWFDRIIAQDAQAAVIRSAQRYRQAIETEPTLRLPS